ncbi:isoleucine--tRNA ligase [Dissulfurimicrobium hydrothermale]|uniref:isoleucine--tRNA ligase n=1 Tax=Dissulfurimicrobium hydrothermale TaxID=1750598 RepID=UPI001EDC918F|nr:isoleucine--tRNA ligase [Dissulfurimicrobium hydrothermale]UKL13694.1 isoleucine--tRNA ligase [Dissulfurimicrobium hydrothermale]
MEYKDTLNLPKTGFPMKANLAQKEPEMLKRWEAMDLYRLLREQGKRRPKFILHDGPPYANGHIHLGHTVNKVLKDIIIKSRQMMGLDAPYIPGWDCHGLPIEHNVEKELGPKKKEMGRLDIRNLCRRYAEKFVGVQRDEFKRLGVLGDWENPYLTMTFDYEASIAREFCRIFNEGHVIKNKKPVHWCPTCVTALAEAEVEYEDHRSPAITVKFKAEDDLTDWLKARIKDLARPASVLIWTTTPWTLPANMAIALHPEFDYLVVEVKDEVWILAEGRLLQILALCGLEQTDARILGRFKGAELEGLSARHPFLDRSSRIILADYVTLEAGTGCVHTAPGHGVDDYESGLKYGLEVYSPVDDLGRFTADVPLFHGKNIFDANNEIIELLQGNGALVSSESLTHSYPHCWRCKRPVIFRATPQWFISMEAGDLRKEALRAIDTVRWIPSWGRERIYGMVESRPDWCISRQRAWGVPVTVFLCGDCEEPVMDEEIAAHLVSIFEKEGADAWFRRDALELLPPDTRCPKCGGTALKKEMDILDVWFDSGVSHAAVLENREGLHAPADLYLEGSDQHRGWFQSSLLTSVAARHRAPYKAVLTHGFVVDKEGKKMSKSVGNVIPPADVIKEYGAEILRLWVSAEDYQDDIKISKEILKRLTEAYRKIRNTIRYLLSNLSDFDPERDTLPLKELEPIDRWALWRLENLIAKVKQAYEDMRFHMVFHQTYQFCTVDMSALYLDILKDRLYCELPAGRLRRSAQSAIYRIVRDLMLLIAPVLSFTADEAWDYLPGDKEESVFLAGFPDVDANVLSEEERLEWERLLSIRAEVTKALETARKEKRIGLALDAKVTLYTSDGETEAFLKGHESIMKMLAIVSQLETIYTKQRPNREDIREAEGVAGLYIKVEPAAGQKCARCWTWSEDVGKDLTFKDVCGRCSGVLRALGLNG